MSKDILQSNSCEPQSKRKNLSKIQNEIVAAGPSNQKSSMSIFKLDIDCCDRIFECLSLKDLHSVAKTCKAMQKIAGEYYWKKLENGL